eukprot:m.424725 g.424725  ORF g.424725 m.424725 type:complete len:306 (-) comp21338_c0_seq49:709-1626(-)
MMLLAFDCGLIVASLVLDPCAGTGPRSVVKYSPHGNIIMLAGFGNLRGEVQFWSRKNLNLINQISAQDTTSYAWCPDSEHLMTATCSPRLKVDNGFKIWHYAKGAPVHKSDIKELWGLCWQPALPGVFPERPLVPVSGATAGAKGKPVHFVPAKTQAYRPPGARDGSGAGAATKNLHELQPAENMRGPKQASEGLSKSALKNKKKREAKAKAAEMAKLTSTGVAPKHKTPEQLAAIATVAAASVTISEGTADGTSQDVEKRLRNLNKKLRQIDALQVRHCAYLYHFYSFLSRIFDVVALACASCG